MKSPVLSLKISTVSSCRIGLHDFHNAKKVEAGEYAVHNNVRSGQKSFP